jgi:hypothetical protein
MGEESVREKGKAMGEVWEDSFWGRWKEHHSVRHFTVFSSVKNTVKMKSLN